VRGGGAEDAFCWPEVKIYQTFNTHTMHLNTKYYILSNIYNTRPEEIVRKKVGSSYNTVQYTVFHSILRVLSVRISQTAAINKAT
jgi:hypothetical protein